MERIWQRLKALIERNSLLIKNFSYLSGLQVANILIQLIVLPYLLKVLGKETYGLVVFAQTIVSYFLILINFGFNYSATLQVSMNRSDPQKLSEIISNTLTLKGLFFIVSCGILICILGSVERVQDYRILFYLMMYLCFYEWIFPVWYFQGIERMKFITIVSLVVRVFFLVMIVLFIRTESHYLRVPLINGIGYSITGVYSLVIVFRGSDIRFVWPKKQSLIFYFKDSLPVFLGSIAGKIKILGNKAVLGALVGMESVAIYDIADKVKEVCNIFLQIVAQVLFPNVSRNRNHKLIRNGIRISFFGGVFMYLSIGVLNEVLIPRFFPSFTSMIPVFWILGIVITIQPVCFLIGTGVLIVNNLKRQYTLNLYISTAVYLLAVFVFYSFDNVNLITLSVSLVVAAATELILSLIVCKRNDKLSWVL